MVMRMSSASSELASQRRLRAADRQHPGHRLGHGARGVHRLPGRPTQRRPYAMKVDSKDGRCRECGGSLEIIDADDTGMTVECDCGEVYLVEPDAFGDGAMKYFLGVHAERMQEGGDEDEAEQPTLGP